MPKAPYEAPKPPECGISSLGLSPAVLRKRDIVKPDPWCLNSDIEYDKWCDPYNPKTITFKDVLKAANILRDDIPETPLKKSRCCDQLEMDLHYKMEIFHTTGSFHERGALYALKMLNSEQRDAGVYTASLGNWAMALAHQGQKLKIPVTVVLLANTLYNIVKKCEEYGATVIKFGNDLAEAKKHAFIMISEQGGTYLNGYDHPDVIAASGMIGIEILEQLPRTDAILVPIGGGGLIAGIATAIKHIRPRTQIYGIEPDKCCNFFKAIENERPYRTVTGQSLAGSLMVPTAGCNAFHTARSLIDKMVLIDDNWITRAVLHMIEQEKVLTEGAGAVALAAFMAVPNILPELLNKTVVCVVTGSNIDLITLPWVIERAKAIEGRIVKVTVTLPADNTSKKLSVFSIIANLECNILKCYTDEAWLMEADVHTVYTSIICETQGLEHACTLKRVMNRLFPGICEFVEEPYSPIPICGCFPKRYPQL